MARKRFNVQFLTIGLLVIVGLGGSYIVWKKFLMKENPQKYIEQAQLAVKEQQWDRAVANFSKAASLRPKDATLWVDLGKAQYTMASPDGSNQMAAVQSWQRATEVDPTNKEAWQNLLTFDQQRLLYFEARPRDNRRREDLVKAFSDVRETATQVIALSPGDQKYLTILPTLDIRMWLLDLPLPSIPASERTGNDQVLTDEQRVDQAVKTLNDLQAKNIEDAESPMWVARVKIRKAENDIRDSQPDDAYALFAEAMTAFDEPIKAKPKNIVPFYINQARILDRLRMSDTRTDARDKYTAKLNETLNLAQAATDMKENPQQFMAVKRYWAMNLQQRDPGRAEQVFQDLIAKFPDDNISKIQLATLLRADPSRRDDALKVLAMIPEAPPIRLSGFSRQELETQIAQGKRLRVAIEIDKLAATPPSKQKDDLAAKIQGELDSLAAVNPKDPAYLKLKGNFEFKQNHVRESIQDFEAALRELNGSSQPPDSELLMLAANSYQFGDQTGAAISLLEDALKSDPNIYNQPTPHVELARLYLNNHNVAGAKRQIEWLNARYPNTLEVVRLQLQTLDPVTQKDEIKQKYDLLVENTPQYMVDKARIAKAIGYNDDAIRLLKAAYTAKPDDSEVSKNYLQLLLQAGQNDEAKKVADAAVKAHPDDVTFAVINSKLSGGSPEVVHDASAKEIERTTTDPYLRELRLADLALSEGKSDDELDHLKKAEAMPSSSTAAQEKLFQHYLAAKQFDLAEPYLKKLASSDADQAHGLVYQLRFAMARADKDGALLAGRQLTDQFPEFANSWEGYGEALQLAGQPDQAADKFSKALEKQPTNTAAMRGLISANYQMGKTDDAKRYITDAQTKFPNDKFYHELAIAHALRYGDPETVLPELTAAVDKAPDVQASYANAANALLRAATVATTKGDTATAKAHIDQASDVLKKAVARWPDSVDFSLNLAQIYVSTGDVDTGVAVAKTFADRPTWKDKPLPYVLISQLYTKANKPDLAEAPMRTAISKTKSVPIDLQIQLSEILTSEKKFDEALKVLEDNRDKGPVVKRRLEVLLGAGRNDQAEAEANLAIQSNPGNAAVPDLLLFVYFSEQKFTEAKVLADKQIAAHPEDIAAYYYRGLANMSPGIHDYDAAISDLSFVRDHSNADTESRFAMSEAYVKKNDYDDAIKELEVALRFSPSDKRFRLRLAQYYVSRRPPRMSDAETIITDSLTMPQYKNDPDFLRAAALMFAQRGDNTRAIASIRAAMDSATEKGPLLHDYLQILLSGQNFPLLIQETNALVQKPANCPWWAYDFRAQAEALSGDKAAAEADFKLALDGAAAERGHLAASTVASHVVTTISIDKAIELIAPRAVNSIKWKLVSIPLYTIKQDATNAISTSEAAMTQFAAFTPEEQDELLTLLGALYLSQDPPMGEKALPIYKQLLDRHPNDLVSMNNIACLLAEDLNPPHLDEALKYSQKAYDMVKAQNKVDAMVYDTYGWVLILSGKDAEGIQALHEIVEDATFADAHYHLAIGYLHKGQIANAARELDAAGAIMNKNKDAGQLPTASFKAKMDKAYEQVRNGAATAGQ